MKNRTIVFLAFYALLMVGIIVAVIAQDRQPGTRPPDPSNCATLFDCQEGVVMLGDRVIYFTDDNNDGLFEKSLAFVIDDVNITAKLYSETVTVGNFVNLYVIPSQSIKSRASPFVIERVKRGRSLGEYQPLAVANR